MLKNIVPAVLQSPDAQTVSDLKEVGILYQVETKSLMLVVKVLFSKRIQSGDSHKTKLFSLLRRAARTQLYYRLRQLIYF